VCGKILMIGDTCQRCEKPMEPKPSVKGQDSFFRFTCDECIAEIEAAPSVTIWSGKI